MGFFILSFLCSFFSFFVIFSLFFLIISGTSMRPQRKIKITILRKYHSEFVITQWQIDTQWQSCYFTEGTPALLLDARSNVGYIGSSSEYTSSKYTLSSNMPGFYFNRATFRIFVHGANAPQIFFFVLILATISLKLNIMSWLTSITSYSLSILACFIAFTKCSGV